MKKRESNWNALQHMINRLHEITILALTRLRAEHGCLFSTESSFFDCIKLELKTRMECKGRLDSLQNSLQESYMSIDAEVFLESVRNGNSDTSSQQMDYELAFRGLLDDIISQIDVTEVKALSYLRDANRPQC